MTLRLSISAATLTVIAVTASVAARQPTKPDAKEMATVQRIRDRIAEREKKTASTAAAAYKVTIPNTTVSYGMAPIPAMARARLFA